MLHIIHEKGTTLSPEEKLPVKERAIAMEKRMEDYFHSHPMAILTAEECQKIFGGLLTSIRRSLTNLATRELLVKDQRHRKMGSMGVSLCTYSLRRIAGTQLSMI